MAMVRGHIQISVPATGEDELNALRRPLESGWLSQGPEVKAFEEAFIARHNVKHAIACSSCTTGLHLILAALGIGPGDEVIVPTFTWVATANVVLYCGATPVFVDVNLQTFNMDPVQVASKITVRTKAIIPVHLFGLCADMDAIADAAPGISLVEDAACASGAVYRGQFAGSLGTAAAFSFHPRKSITTGEGGMVTTNDDQLAERINILRNHGASVSEEQRHNGPKPWILPDFNLLGYNYRMTDLQGAVGLVQLGKLERFIEERQRWAEYYQKNLTSIDWLVTPSVPAGYKHAWQAYVCLVNENKAPMSRNLIMDQLHRRGISTRPGTHAVHMLGLYSNRFKLQADDFSNAKKCAQMTMALPLHNRMTKEDFDHVIASLQDLK